ncbi:glycoside hydrolase family 16 protein [Mycena floridula]|nr:glycoside hydrolase family 16 protein [Mycena floridula]
MNYDFAYFFLFGLIFWSTPCTAVLRNDLRDLSRSFSAKLWPSIEKRAGSLETNPDGSTFLWLPQDEYSGKTFFDAFGFFTDADPTSGTVNYVTSSVAFANGLAYVEDDGTVIMKGDDTTWLADGQYRDSVRISSLAQYNTGLFILDLNRAPWGCSVWPAFWTLGGGTWPDTGEIDIIEGVHDNEHNQVTFHSSDGCFLTPNASFTGSVVTLNGVNNTVCNGRVNSNAGCGVTEFSRASYGPYFDAQGGGVFAMKWDENGIAVCKSRFHIVSMASNNMYLLSGSFYRAAIPQDILAGSPNPSNWGVPVALLEPAGCDPLTYFVNHSIVFDITFCGDWAGNSYATSGCPGTCADRLKDPTNFANASWSINSLKVYRKQLVNGKISKAAALYQLPSSLVVVSLALVMSIVFR